MIANKDNHVLDDGSSRKRKREAIGNPISGKQNDASTSIATNGSTTLETAYDERGREMAECTVPSTGSGMVHTTPEPHVTFHVGSEVRRVPQSKLLSYIWRDGLDSDCMVCGDQFVLGAPVAVRTIGFEYSQALQPSIIDITQTALAPHPIRIYNRHIACIKSKKIDYIPVSHAWHEGIAKAQDEGVDDINAAWLAYQIPVRTLLAATKKYGPIEIWHDYLSVPQWQKETQQQLLLSIPAIYSYPESMIMHLDDVRACHLSQAYEDQSYESFIEGLASTIRSRWFDRMWVTLEYIQSNEVLMLTEEFEINNVSAGDLSLRISNLAGKYVKRGGHGQFMQHLNDRGSKWIQNVSWTDMESWKTRLDKHRTFGAAIYILGMKQCREPRDRYFALGGMVGFTTIEPDELPGRDTFEYLFSLALHALTNGDYTPLLLNPLPEELQDARAPWLRGYSQMSERSWDLGVCHKRAHSTEIIKDGIIQPELEPVGIIEWFEHANFEADPETVFMHTATQILRSSGTCPMAFCEAVDRIFTRIERKALYTEWELKETRKPAPPSPCYDYTLLGKLLEDFSALHYGIEGQDTNPQMLELSRRMVRLLQLNKPGKLAADSRMAITHAEAQWYVDKYGRDMEGLGRIRCKFCARRSLFRLTLWEKPKVESAQLFRIPGLLFDETIPDGVGLVVCEGLAIGKMIYGTPSCKCHRSERVRLGCAVLRKED